MNRDYVITDDMLEITSYTQEGKLPDPFLMENGERVRSLADWESAERNFIKTSSNYNTAFCRPKMRF